MPKSRRILITGSNRGIGLGVAAAYAERGDQVFAVCRAPSPELEALDVEIVAEIELTDDASVATLRDRVGEDGLDVLVCNAGTNNDSPGLEDIDVNALAAAYDVNTLGAVRTVLALLPALNDGAKIMLVSSMGLVPLGILGTRTVGNYGYRMSKAALVSFGFGLAHDVRDRDIAVVLSSPGRVATDMLLNVYREGRTTKAAVDEATPIAVAGQRFRDRLDRLTVAESPALDRDPEGNPAIPADVLELLREANSAQVGQASEMAATLD